MTLLLTNKDVRGLLDMPTLIEAMRRAFQELGRGDAAAVGRV
ncbi:MAG: ornithine cyclodeaminase family protein, partial [Nitriliruptorales bacterium]|nr:ornithine cyclodeaminase family protein [Nitriliruptorales bacterium]